MVSPGSSGCLQLEPVPSEKRKNLPLSGRTADPFTFRM
jgi:hypothetical protein